jgi:sec-independent protein translocase protein TatA
MFGLGTSEILLIAGAGILLFGARRLPEIGSALGRGFRNFKKTLEGREEESSESNLHHKKTDLPEGAGPSNPK